MRRSRRNTELGLLVGAAAITTGIYVLASLGRFSTIPANVGPFLGVVLGLLIVAHIATRRLAPQADGLLLPLAGLLNGIGYVFIARLDDGLAALQSTWTFVGVGAYVATLVLVRRTRDLQRYRYTFMLAGLVLLGLPLLPVLGQEVNGARIWVNLGPLNFQPGEFAKLALAVFFASYLVDKRELLRVSTYKLGPLNLPEPKYLGPVLLGWGASLIVMFYERDLGSSLLFFTLFLVVLWIATERAAYLLMGGTLFLGGAVFAWSQFTHVQTRVDVWLDPWQDPRGDGFQIVEAAFAFGSGGLTGTGPGLGDPGRIPFAETDFIFAAIGEELGLLGATAVLVTFMLMIGTGLRIALAVENDFTKLLAAGLTTLLGVQAFIIIAGVIRVLPLTGVTLPFVSYGGSSLVANYVLLALLVRISDEAITLQKVEPGRPRETLSPR
ncbi:MAG: FtsW/RodA/SpoVE family cell cycle protein [Acidimicrobiales bacterium]